MCLKMLGGGGGILPEDFRAIGRRFDKSQKIMILIQNSDITCICKFSFKYLFRALQQIKIFCVQ